ncbi:hypothetical protein SAMN04488034_101628 [Salinimicrobium catena]|uniref:Adhesin domain-containing protein n=1 Tax=Salinimicrobium catena TaxID=390640 RepID=A0A1H5J525_9FLAO|nr:hypothetical protein [Salinimicrobium catena]SDK84215.1 hypothetical protein SAMN04488140_101627 [Salinimicrobium catena]SEE47530.1 hypothetical protein SAMN04488034_101628 [Salinimicrobium catena]
MKYFLITFLLLSFSGRSQKATTRTIDAGDIESIVLNSEEIYKVSISTVPGNVISISSKTEGEYFNNISLDEKVRDNTLYLESRFRKILQSGFDKLSAHKVFAMELELKIPENMRVEIRSNVASVFMEGDYDEVLIQLKSGSAYLEDFQGDAVINTYNGNIEVETQNTLVEAESRHGAVAVPDSVVGNYSLKLMSINGNIKVRETK